MDTMWQITVPLVHSNVPPAACAGLLMFLNDASQATNLGYMLQNPGVTQEAALLPGCRPGSLSFTLVFKCTSQKDPRLTDVCYADQV